MYTAKNIVSDITSKKEVKSIAFVACGGSRTAMNAARMFVEKNAIGFRTGDYNANEFIHSTPKYIGENSIVVLASQSGNTPETVKAAAHAKSLGASVIALSYVKDSQLAKESDYEVIYEWGEGSTPSLHKASHALRIAMETLAQTEGWADYGKAYDAFAKIDGIIAAAVEKCSPDFAKFAKEFKDDKVIYTMGSGENFIAAHQETICILMEMQWINSSAIHSGDYFHGPFEITDDCVPFIQYMTCGRNRPLDERALTFLKKHGKRYMSLDAKALGMDALAPEVAEYLEPLFFVTIMNTFNEMLATERDHPLSTRRYMWKIEY